MTENLDAAFGYPAWRSFIAWAFDDQDIRDLYCHSTGRAWPTPPANGLEALIDQATSHRDEHMHDFICWATAELYGADLAPPAVQAAIAARGSK